MYVLTGHFCKKNTPIHPLRSTNCTYDIDMAEFIKKHFGGREKVVIGFEIVTVLIEAGNYPTHYLMVTWLIPAEMLLNFYWTTQCYIAEDRTHQEEECCPSNFIVQGHLRFIKRFTAIMEP
jgi:hypothetical protein